MKIFFLSVILLLAFAVYPQGKKHTNLLTSVEIAANFFKLHPDSIIYHDEEKSRKWNYEQGLMLETFFKLYEDTRKHVYTDYIKKNLDYYIGDNGEIKTYKSGDFTLDNVAPGRALLELYKFTNNVKYKIAADLLREQLKRQPRTTEGGFWHKKIYPNQMWLDGLFMAEPFYAEYASMFGDKEAFDDIANQFILIEKHTRDMKTGLLYHGWDESRLQKWADSVNGTSPCFWGRAIGWYMMALVDVLDYFPKDHPKRNDLLESFRELSESLLNYRDADSKLWYQVVDKGSLEGNYIESSGSAMFIYSYAKGVNKGYLDNSYWRIAEESFRSLQDNFITHENDVFNLTNVCAGAGLGGTPYRDGSYSYYIHETKRINDFKGYGPLLLASIELENRARLKYNDKKVGLDYYYNHEFKNGKRYHYIWEDKENSGFSDLGDLFKKQGSEIDSLTSAPTQGKLNKFSIYIIVDPDTPQETAKPNYIELDAINEIKTWVKDGGVLVLLANDSANCEFTHLNKLAEEFGIHFNEDSENRVKGDNYDVGKFDKFPEHPLFVGINKIYLKEISTLKLTLNAVPVLTRGDKVFMASAQFGKGFVYAVGDPWLYNEYIDNRKLPEEFDNFTVANNLISWLLSKTMINK